MENEGQLHNIRHSLAHLLAIAVLKHDPKAKLGIGPVIENGFYYDFLLSRPLKESDLSAIEKNMKKLIGSKLDFTGREISKKEGEELFKDQPFKLELLEEFSKDNLKLTVYTTGTFTDLCRGGHVQNTSKINANGFKLERIAGAYWKSDQERKQLTRIYGLAFETKDELDGFLRAEEEAVKRDHKKLGRELDLFLIDEKVGRGLPMWTPRGTAVKFELEKFTRELERKYGYEHIATPYLGSEELYRTSGHLDHYSRNMYAPIDMDGDKFYLRPMACPHHIRMYQRKLWSYKELPVRYAEIADYNRYEKSGELMGMIRVRKFQLTDGHIFVTPEGLKEEFKKVCDMIVEGMGGLGLLDIVSYRFSLRDPKNTKKYYPDDNLWNHAEGLMKEALDELELPYVTALDEAAFYGPKLDVQAKNVHGKEDTLFTAQMDFLLPQKFEMEYVDANGEKKRPVMIHRSTIGCLERVFGFLIENYGGAFPLWLSPVQVVIIPISEKFISYGKEVLDKLRGAGIRGELDSQNETLGKRLRNNKMLKTPYIVIVGEQEAVSGKLTAESRDRGQLKDITPEQFMKDILEESRAKK
ncbi:MAG: threonine--tRNA ligase [Candidatus Vogelbacteria bacterium]|nr:threonine--tRNA ligase [Candidatus Vogelbacteria bacterium]